MNDEESIVLENADVVILSAMAIEELPIALETGDDEYALLSAVEAEDLDASVNVEVVGYAVVWLAKDRELSNALETDCEAEA